MRGLLPDDVLRGMEEQLSGSCTIEIAAFDEFAALLGDDADDLRALDDIGDEQLGFLAADRQRHDRAGKHDGIPNREDREQVGDARSALGIGLIERRHAAAVGKTVRFDVAQVDFEIIETRVVVDEAVVTRELKRRRVVGIVVWHRWRCVVFFA